MDAITSFPDRALARSNTALSKINIPTLGSIDRSKGSSKADPRAPVQSPTKSSSRTSEPKEISSRAFPSRTESLKAGIVQTSDHKHSKPHLHRRHHHSRAHHSSARETIHSAVQLQNPFSFDFDYNPLRRSHHDKDKHQSHHHYSSHRSRSNQRSHSPDPSRRNPTDLNNQDQQKTDARRAAEDAIQPLKRVIRPEDVVREKKRRELRGDEVAAALNALSRDAYTATRKLDDTYYALLERLGMLKQAVQSLQDLSVKVVEARTAWDGDVEVTGREVEEKIGGFGGFEGQERAVEELMQRLRHGKEKAGLLEGRLETCRGRLENIQREEERERRVVHKRWGLCLGVLAAFVLLVVLVVVWRQKRGKPDLLGEIREKSVELAADVGVAGIVGKGRVNRSSIGVRLVDDGYEKQRLDEEKKWERLMDEL